MNCKPGDLAIVVRADGPTNIGKIVCCVKYLGRRTLRGARGIQEHECWLIDPELPTFDGTGLCCEAPDAWLRPIQDPGDDAQDETLQWLPVPSVEKEAA